MLISKTVLYPTRTISAHYRRDIDQQQHQLYLELSSLSAAAYAPLPLAMEIMALRFWVMA